MDVNKPTPQQVTHVTYTLEELKVIHASGVAWITEQLFDELMTELIALREEQLTVEQAQLVLHVLEVYYDENDTLLTSEDATLCKETIFRLESDLAAEFVG